MLDAYVFFIVYMMKWEIDKVFLQTWVFGKTFLKGECRELVTSKETIGSICCQSWNSDFKPKVEFWKTLYHHEFDSFCPNFSDEIDGDFNKYGFFIL